MALDALVREVEGSLKAGKVFSDEVTRTAYSYDATPGYRGLPDFVVFASSPEEVSEVLRIASLHGIPVIPRGAGTSLCAGAVPVSGGISLVLSKMNRIIKVDPDNCTAVVEPGVVTADLHAAVEAQRLFYPPDPGSMKVCTLGGNVAANAGGLRGVKYGVTRDYLLGLEAVLASGTRFRVGGETIKNVTGYDLPRLLAGSEGTLAVFTEIILKLLPMPESRRSILAPFSRMDDAAHTILSIFSAGVTPAILEIMDRVTIRAVEQWKSAGLPLDASAVLLIEVDGPEEAVQEEAQAVLRACSSNGATGVRTATTMEEREELWTARRSALSALARVKPTTILEDATVPRGRIPEMFRSVERIASIYGVQIGTFGHAGDGNFHPTVLTDLRDPEEKKKAEKAIGEIFRAALRLGGTLTGEHGIGAAKARFLPLEAGPTELRLYRDIKAVFDPKGILNPHKAIGDRTGGSSVGSGVR
ncbi:MAG: FAD-binding protein [Firmicutes bacterium]|nr:FAD-binding protein [Bacillota bacterium]